MFGYVIKRSNDDFIVNVELDDYFSGYNVVSKETDPDNAYDIEDVRAYCEEHPEMVFSSHPLSDRVALEVEMETLKRYLSDTDYMVVKCMERGLSMEDVYPDEYEKRQESRDRINEIEALMEG